MPKVESSKQERKFFDSRQLGLHWHNRENKDGASSLQQKYHISLPREKCTEEKDHGKLIEGEDEVNSGKQISKTKCALTVIIILPGTGKYSQVLMEA